MTDILLCLYKHFIGYDRAKTEKIGNFFALTWLIFAGLVTFILSIFSHFPAVFCSYLYYFQQNIIIYIWNRRFILSTMIFVPSPYIEVYVSYDRIIKYV